MATPTSHQNPPTLHRRDSSSPCGTFPRARSCRPLDIPEQGLDPRPVRAATRTGLVIGLQLYFPNVRDVVRSIGLVSETTADPNPGFWAELSDDKRSADGIAACSRGTGRWRSRVPTIPYASSRDDSKWRRAQLRWIPHEHQPERCVPESRFTAPAGSVVDLDFTIPVARARETVLAFVVHVAERRGVGVQFIVEATSFRSRLDE